MSDLLAALEAANLPSERAHFVLFGISKEGDYEIISEVPHA